MNYQVSSSTASIRHQIRFKIVGIAAVASWIIAGLGCDSAPKTAAQSSASAHADAAAPDDSAPGEKKVETGPNAVIAEAGEVQVTLADFEHSSHMSRLVSPLEALDIPREELASPRLQTAVVQSLLRDKIIRHQAAKYKLKPTTEERIAALESRPDIARFAPLLAADAYRDIKPDAPEAFAEVAAEFSQRGLTIADLEFAADSIVLEHKLRDALLDQIVEEDVWRDYRRENDRARVLQVHISNTPTMDELLAFLKAHPEEIEAYFTKNRRKWERNDRTVEFDDAMRRHIAAILVAEKGPLPSVQKKVRRAIKKMEQLPEASASKASKKKRAQAIDKLIEEFKAQGLSASRTELFSNTARGFIPGIGIAREFSQEIFKAKLSDPVSPRPILSNKKLWAFMLLEREYPSREAFERDKAEVSAEFRARAKGVIVDQFVMKLLEVNQAELNLDPIQAKYGNAEDAKSTPLPKSAAAEESEAK